MTAKKSGSSRIKFPQNFEESEMLSQKIYIDPKMVQPGNSGGYSCIRTVLFKYNISLFMLLYELFFSSRTLTNYERRSKSKFNKPTILLKRGQNIKIRSFSESIDNFITFSHNPRLF